MAHTRGPWKVIPNDRDAPAGVQAQGGVIICDVFGTFDANGNFIGQFDNARLVAAAPELLDIVAGMVLFPDVRKHIAEKFPGFIKQAEAAIDKATGRAA